MPYSDRSKNKPELNQKKNVKGSGAGCWGGKPNNWYKMEHGRKKSNPEGLGGGAGKELEDAETEPGNKRLSKYFHRAKRVVMTT